MVGVGPLDGVMVPPEEDSEEICAVPLPRDGTRADARSTFSSRWERLGVVGPQMFAVRVPS